MKHIYTNVGQKVAIVLSKKQAGELLTSYGLCVCCSIFKPKNDYYKNK